MNEKIFIGLFVAPSGFEKVSYK